MEKFIKKTIIVFIVAVILIGIAAFVGYKLYHYIIDDATIKIRSCVSGGIGDAVNPLNIPKRIFGSGNK